MPDDTISARIINEQLHFTGLNFIENLHINETVYGDGPQHFNAQGTFSEAFYGGTVTGHFSDTINQNHFTAISDYTYSYGGNTYETKANYSSNANGDNLVLHTSINGVDQPVQHYSV